MAKTFRPKFERRVHEFIQSIYEEIDVTEHDVDGDPKDVARDIVFAGSYSPAQDLGDQIAQLGIESEDIVNAAIETLVDKVCRDVVAMMEVE